MKKYLIILIAILMCITLPIFAEDANWWNGQIMQKIEATGLVNISQQKVDDILYLYRGKQFTDATYSELENKLYALDGVSYIQTDVSRISDNSDNSIITFNFTEIPMVQEIQFEGNDKVSSSDLLGGIINTAVGKFFDVDLKMATDSLVNQVQSVYLSKGYDDSKVEFSSKLNKDTNKVTLIFKIDEGIQKKIVDIAFEGNKVYDSKTLSGTLTSKKKSLFQAGYLNTSNVEKDKQAIIAYYQKHGYIDAVITATNIENVESEDNLKYQPVKLVYEINEGLKWIYDGITVEGNKVFSDEQINDLITLKTGGPVNLEAVSNQFTAISDLYYNNGYIKQQINV